MDLKISMLCSVLCMPLHTHGIMEAQNFSINSDYYSLFDVQIGVWDTL